MDAVANWAEAKEIAAMIESRGTRLRAPASEQLIGELESAIGGPLSAQSRAIFSTFDGFDDEMADDETMVCLWSVRAILEAAASAPHEPNGQLVADYFLGAESMCCNLCFDEAPVWWVERRTIAAASFLHLCREIAEGSFKP